jgi:hypothetical protein
MPAGFHVASAWVDIHAEDAGLRNEIKRAIQGAVQGQEGEVDLNVNASDLRARVQNAVRSATSGADGEVKLNLDSAALRARVQSAVRAATSGTSGEVDLNLDAAAFRGKVAAAVSAASRDRIQVQMDLDSAGLQAKVRAATSALRNNIAIGVDLKDDEFKSKLASMVAIGNAAEINIDADVNTAGLTAKMQSVIAGLSNQNIPLKVDVDAAGAAAKVNAVLRNLKAKVGLDVDSARLVADVTASMRAATTAASAIGAKVKVGADTTEMMREIGTAVAYFNTMEKVRINTDVDTAGMQAQVQAAVRAAGATTRIRVGTDIDYVGPLARFRAAIAGFRPTIHVDVDIDRNRWQAGMQALADSMNNVNNQAGRMSGSLMRLGGLASSPFQAIGAAAAIVGPIIAVLIADVMLLAAALAAIVVPAGIIALGAYLTSATNGIKEFGAQLKQIGSEVAAVMGPALQSAFQSIIASLNQMRPALTQMFAGAAQLVQPFAQALTNLVSGALPGLTAGLNNMRAAMPGIQSGFQQIGASVGNFFQQLTQNGAAIGQLWDTIGQGINRVMTQLGSSMSQLASNPQVIQMLAMSFEILAQTIDVVSRSISAFAPMLLQMMQAFSSGMEVIGPLIEGVGRLANALSTLSTGGGPIAAFKQLFGKGKSDADEFKKSLEGIGQAAGPLSSAVSSGAAQASAALQQQAAAAEKLAQKYREIGQSMGQGGMDIAAKLESAKAASDALGQSFAAMARQATTSLGGQINLDQSISKAKSEADGLNGALKMTHGVLDTTSTKAQQAATNLNNIAQAAMQSAEAFAAEGNWAAAGAAIDKARSSITSLGQQMGLSKSEAQDLANQLTTFPDKEIQFKLDIAQAQAGLQSVEQAFNNVAKGEKKVTVTAVTDSARAALEELGFKVKDLGNGKMSVTAETGSAKAALDGLQAVLDGLMNSKASVQVSADQVPAVSAALEALGAKVESLPNGDVKVTAQDGASTIIDAVKGKVDNLPTNKQVGIGVVAKGLQTAEQTKTLLDDIPENKNVKFDMAGNVVSKARETKTVLDDIPANKSTSLDATGNAQQMAGEVEMKINGLPSAKQIMVLVSVSGTEDIQKLEALNKVQNKAIAVNVSITGTERIGDLEKLNKVNSKQISVNVSITGNINQIGELEKLNAVKGKSINVVVSIQGNIDKIKELEKLNAVRNKMITANVSITGNIDKIKELENLNKVANKNISVNVSISGADQIDKLKQLNNIHSKTISVQVNANPGPITQMKTALDGVKSKSVSITATANVGPINSLKSAMDRVKSKSVKVTATAPAGQVNALKAAIDRVKSKSVTITANVNGTGAVNGLVAAIAAVRSKTVTVTVKTQKVGSAATGGHMTTGGVVPGIPGFAQGGRSYTGGGGVHGIGSGTSDSILSWLSNGEFVIRASMVKKYGTPLLAAINHGVFNPYANAFKAGANRMFPGLPGFASGGQVGSGSSSTFKSSSSSKSNTDKAVQNFVTYTIRWGDNLTKIAKKFGTSVDELVKLNKIKNKNLIYAGDTLKIPTKGPKPPAGSVKPVIPGTKPGDPWFLPAFSTGKLTPWTTTTGEGKNKKTTPTADSDKLKELVAGGGAFVSQFMFPGNNDKDFVTKVLGAQDLKALTGIMDDLRYTVQDAFKNDEKLSAWLQSGMKILGNAQKMKDNLSKSLEEAKKHVDELNQAFDQLKDSVAQNIMKFGDLVKTGGKGASAETMIRQLTADVGRSAEFAQGLEALQGRGLDASIIAQLGAAGPVEGMIAARSLLKATPEQIAEINRLQSQLKFAADQAGDTAATAMYGAGLAAAEGLVAGIQANIDGINAVMKQIAEAMAGAVKQALGIKSPSRVFHGIGVNTVQGLVQGFTAEGQSVPAMVRNFVDNMIANGQATPGLTGVSDRNSGTIGGVNAAGGDIHIGNINVSVDGGQWDLTKTTDRRALAKALVNEIMDEIREQTKKRK